MSIRVSAISRLGLLTMGISLVVVGLFLLFALGFNGSVGGTLVNYTFFASALFILAAGATKILGGNFKFLRIFCSAAMLLYLPMIWQRFNFNFGLGRLNGQVQVGRTGLLWLLQAVREGLHNTRRSVS